MERRSWLENGENPYGRCWAEVWWFFVRGVEQAFPEGDMKGLVGGVVGEVMGEGVEEGGGGVPVGAVDSSAPHSTPASAVVGVVGDGGRAGGRHRGSDDGGGSGGKVDAVGHAVKRKKQTQGGVERNSVGIEGSSEREDERLDSDKRDGSDAPPKDRSTITTQNGGGEIPKRETGKQEVVYVEKIVYVDRPVVDVQTVEKTVVEKVTEKVEKIREVEVERIKEVRVEVDKTPPKKQKIQLSKWGRVKKTSMKLGKSTYRDKYC